MRDEPAMFMQKPMLPAAIIEAVDKMLAIQNSESRT